MEIKGSATKHGWTRADMVHALTNAVRVWSMDGYDMVIGPAANGVTILEVGIDRDGDAFHCMKARPKFL